MHVSFVRQAYITREHYSHSPCYNLPEWFVKVMELFPIDIPFKSPTYCCFSCSFIYAFCFQAGTYSTGPGCCREILWPDSLIRSGSCWHERWEPPWAVVHPSFMEEERQSLCGQEETYRANTSVVLLQGVPMCLTCVPSWLEGWMLQVNSQSLCHAWHQIGYFANKWLFLGYLCCAERAQ